MKLKSQHCDWQWLIGEQAWGSWAQPRWLPLSAASSRRARSSYQYTRRCLKPTPPPACHGLCPCARQHSCQRSEAQTSVTKAPWTNQIISTAGAGKLHVPRTGELHPNHGPGLLLALTVAPRNTQPWDEQHLCPEQAEAKGQQRLQMRALECRR